MNDIQELAKYGFTEAVQSEKKDYFDTQRILFNNEFKHQIDSCDIIIREIDRDLFYLLDLIMGKPKISEIPGIIKTIDSILSGFCFICGDVPDEINLTSNNEVIFEYKKCDYIRCESMDEKHSGAVFIPFYIPELTDVKITDNNGKELQLPMYNWIKHDHGFDRNIIQNGNIYDVSRPNEMTMRRHVRLVKKSEMTNVMKKNLIIKCRFQNITTDNFFDHISKFSWQYTWGFLYGKKLFSWINAKQIANFIIWVMTGKSDNLEK